MTEQALQPNERLKTITDLLEMRKGEIAKAAPRILDTKRLMRICLSSIQKNPLLLECSPASLVRCVMDAATFGLIPDGATNEAHLVPFYSSKKKGHEAQFMPGYSGIIKLALQSGYINGVELHEVYQNDEFEYEYGLTPKLIHRPAEGKPGDLRAVYCIVILTPMTSHATGHKTFEVMTIEKVIEHRDKFTKSKNKDGKVFGPWADHFSAMALKTVLKRGLKYTPKSSELAGALKLDGLQEAGKDRDDPDILDIKPSGPVKTGVEGFDNALEAGGEDDIPIETPKKGK
jgi:recombination protein RecT